MTGRATVRVELVELERVVPRGTARTSWLVRREDVWVKASEWPGATLESRDPGPGTVWERAVHVDVAEGTRILRVDVRPKDVRRADPLSYLTRAKGTTKHTRRTVYRVERRGRLVVDTDPREEGGGG